MKVPPSDLNTALVQQALGDHWRITGHGLQYVPLGFGDHHWHAVVDGKRFFVTVRDARLDGRTTDRRQAVLLLE